MAPSPSSVSLNTPGQAAAAPSPLNPQEEQMYREKYRQLTKYIEPLKRMVARIGNDGKHTGEISYPRARIHIFLQYSRNNTHVICFR